MKIVSLQREKNSIHNCGFNAYKANSSGFGLCC